MYRCARMAATAAIVALVAPALAQVPRSFPQNALRGVIAIGAAPEIALNGEPARLAPSARIHKADNLLALPAQLLGQRFAVHYTFGIGGLVNEVWILRPEELAKKPWPRTPEEASAWRFDPVAQTWTRP